MVCVFDRVMNRDLLVCYFLMLSIVGPCTEIISRYIYGTNLPEHYNEIIYIKILLKKS